MKLFYCCLLILGVGALAKERTKRQASYSFPGPRTERGYRPAPSYAEDQDDRDSYEPPRRQFQAQPVQPQYAPTAQARAAPPQAAPVPPAPAAPPVYETPRAAAPAAPAPRAQSRPAARRASSSSRGNKYGSAPQQNLNGHDEEEEQGPDPLTLLLQDSQFSCGGKTDGYYADDSVNCQVFHYCVGGAKHSWMCPENTVFHQVHLNCVPDAQDICQQSQKFHFVNDYLYKAVDYEGPNNTARYSQRYYPDGYANGDAFVTTAQESPRRPAPQTYPAPAAPAPRPPPRQVAPSPPQQPTYRAPSSQSSPASYRPSSGSRPASRPSRPVESYPREAEAPPAYRVVSQPPSASAAQSYRPSQAQQAPRQPSPQAYRVVQQDAPPASHSGSYSSEESPYPVAQPQPQPQARRPSSSQAQGRPTAGYTPPREQYRPSARSAAGYPAYSSNQGAGVQYDEDY